MNIFVACATCPRIGVNVANTMGIKCVCYILVCIDVIHNTSEISIVVG
jgi:hypothetical protein